MFKQVYEKRKRVKYLRYYVVIALSAMIIIVSLIMSILIVKNYNTLLNIYKEQEQLLIEIAEQERLEQERLEEERIKRESSEDYRLQLTSTAQKERDNFKYNKNVQADIDKIFDSNKKEVYLTFDDGPSKYTNEILDILKEEDIKATFFVLGNKIKGREDELRRIYNEGHTVANHSYTHQYASIYKTPAKTLEEYNKTEKAFKKVLGSDFNSNLFRFPGGSVGGYYESQKKKSRDYFTKKKIAFVDWNCLTDDSVGKDTVKKQFKEFNRTRKNKKALIVLQHDSDTVKNVAKTLKLIIKELKEENYVFKNFNHILVKEVKVKENTNDTKKNELNVI